MRKKVKINKCECKFPFPHPLRVKEGHVIRVGDKDRIEEFFCDFCKGLITNNQEYIKEVIKFYSYQRWGHMKWNPHRNRDYELEEGNKHFLKEYKELLGYVS